MTRETKLGLAVGTSFLALVAVVVFTTLRKGEQLPPAPDIPQPSVQNKKKPDKPDPKARPGALPPDLIADQGMQSGKGLPQIQPLPPNGNGGPTLPLPAPGGLPGAPAGPGAFGQSAATQPISPAPVLAGQLPPLPPPAGLAGAGNPGITLPIGPAASDPLPPLPVAPKSSGFDLPQIPGSEQPKGLPGAPGGIQQIPPLADLLPKNPGMGDIPLPGAPGVTLPSNPLLPLPGDKPVSPPGGGFGTIPDPKQAAPASPASLPGNPTVPKQPLPGGPGLDIGSKIGVGNPAAPLPVAPPGVSTTTGKPLVESFDERRYVCTPADTDFTVVSKRFYNVDKYAIALIEFNRDHPMGKDAVRQAPRLAPGMVVFVPPVNILESKYPRYISNSPQMQADASRLIDLNPADGSKPGFVDPAISSPPKAMVPVTNGPPSGSPPGTGSPVPVAPRSPVPGPWGNPAATPAQPVQPGPIPGQPGTPLPQAATPPSPGNGVVPAAAWSNPTTQGAGQSKMYWVPQGGKRLWEIARETLGNSERWAEIYRLNPQYPPEQVIPAGVQLKLPPDARLGQ